MAKSRAVAAKQSREPSGGSRAVKCSDDGPIEAYCMNRVGGTDQTPTSRLAGGCLLVVVQKAGVAAASWTVEG